MTYLCFRTQGSFHIIYYIRDGLVARGLCDTYKLDPDKNYRFLRLPDEPSKNQSMMRTKRNVDKFKKFSNVLEDLEFTEDQISSIYSIVAAILNLGEIDFKENEDTSSNIENKEVVDSVAELLEVDSKKISWALTNYCVVRDGKAMRKRNSCQEAREARDVFANTLYARLVDYVVNEVNEKLAVGKQILYAYFFYGFIFHINYCLLPPLSC